MAAGAQARRPQQSKHADVMRAPPPRSSMPTSPGSRPHMIGTSSTPEPGRRSRALSSRPRSGAPSSRLPYLSLLAWASS